MHNDINGEGRGSDRDPKLPIQNTNVRHSGFSIVFWVKTRGVVSSKNVGWKHMDGAQ